MARHKAHLPWRGIRRRYRELSARYQHLQRSFRTLEAQWSETFQEMLRLQSLYEPVPDTTWGVANATALRAGTALPESPTEEIPVVFVRPDILRTGTDPADISLPATSAVAVIQVSSDGTAEVIGDESR